MTVAAPEAPASENAQQNEFGNSFAEEKTGAGQAAPESAASENTPADDSSGSGAGDADVSSGIDEGLAELAKSYGLDPTQWPDQASLSRAVANFDRQLANFARQGFGQQQPQEPQRQAALQQQQRQNQPPSDFKLDLKALPKEGYDEEMSRFSEGVVNAMQALHGHLSPQLQAFEQRFGEIAPVLEKVQAMEQFMQAQAQERYASDMDAAFGSLGPEWEERFGKGPMGSLQPHSAQVADRLKLESELEAIQRGDAMMGRRQSFQQQFKRALAAAFGDHLPTIERRKIAKAAAERKNGALARPANRSGKPLDHESAVIEKLRAWREKQSD